MLSRPVIVPASEILKLVYRMGMGAQFASSFMRRIRREIFRPHSCVGDFENRSVLNGMITSANHPSSVTVVLRSQTPSQSLLLLPPSLKTWLSRFAPPGLKLKLK